MTSTRLWLLIALVAVVVCAVEFYRHFYRPWVALNSSRIVSVEIRHGPDSWTLRQTTDVGAVAEAIARAKCLGCGVYEGKYARMVTLQHDDGTAHCLLVVGPTTRSNYMYYLGWRVIQSDALDKLVVKTTGSYDW